MTLISRRFVRAVAVAAILGLGLPAAAFAADSGSHIVVQNPWARASAAMSGNGAAFMTITNDGTAPDRLVSAASPVCEMAELHTHLMEGGVMKMRQIDGVDVDPGTPTVLQPGGLHIMLMQLKTPLKEGGSFPVTLTFAKAGAVTVDVKVLSPGAMGMKGDMPGMPGMPMGH